MQTQSILYREGLAISDSLLSLSGSLFLLLLQVTLGYPRLEGRGALKAANSCCLVGKFLYFTDYRAHG